jgi:predicted regulator of Ras-like GTPase activity (Roadblock/LC7/MglB family)
MFATILRELVDDVPGARGAVFCDGQGESVNAIGASGRHAPEMVNDFELRVAAAQLATPLDLAQVRGHDSLGSLKECVIAGGRETLLVHMLPEGYYLLLCLEPDAQTGWAMQRLRAAARRVAVEI